jgi:hypothetical protein
LKELKQIEIMKTTKTNSRKGATRQITIVGLFLMAMASFNLSFAQDNSSSSAVVQQGKTISGIVDSEEGPIYGANVLLKGSKIGTTTQKDGTFTFPKPLNVNDILVFSYLGYETQEIKILDSTSFMKVILTADFIEITGAIAVDKPYKSKRKN